MTTVATPGVDRAAVVTRDAGRRRPAAGHPLEGQRKAVASDALVPRGLVAPFIYGYSHPVLFVGLTAVGIGAAPGSPAAHASVGAVTAQDRSPAPHRARGSGSYVEHPPP